MPERGAPPAAERSLADRWVLARLDEVVALVRDAWNGYDVTAGTRAIMDFVSDDLSNWYVRTNRPRFWADRKSTRLNSSHGYISYAVFCLKKKKKRNMPYTTKRYMLLSR